MPDNALDGNGNVVYNQQKRGSRPTGEEPVLLKSNHRDRDALAGVERPDFPVIPPSPAAALAMHSGAVLRA
jgi:hypothetical protein